MGTDRGFMCDLMAIAKSLPRVVQHSDMNKAIMVRLKWQDAKARRDLKPS